jgi:hypothetical protein
LILAGKILAITGITIKETGEADEEVPFEITGPKVASQLLPASLKFRRWSGNSSAGA